MRALLYRAFFASRVRAMRKTPTTHHKTMSDAEASAPVKIGTLDGGGTWDRPREEVVQSVAAAIGAAFADAPLTRCPKIYFRTNRGGKNAMVVQGAGEKVATAFTKEGAEALFHRAKRSSDVHSAKLSPYLEVVMCMKPTGYNTYEDACRSDEDCAERLVANAEVSFTADAAWLPTKPAEVFAMRGYGSLYLSKPWQWMYDPWRE